MNGTALALVAVALLVGTALGYLIAASKSSRANSASIGEIATLKEKLRQAEVGRQALEGSIEASTQAIELAVSRKMKEYTDQLARGATETFAGQAKRSFEGLVGPLAEELKRLDAALDGMRTSQSEQLGGLGQALSELVTTHIPQLRDQTASLARAMSAPSTKGLWGEVQLKRVIELAGMTRYCDFDEQPSFSDNRGTARPDVVVHLPGGREIVIDAKVPLDAFFRLSDAQGEEERRELRKAHAVQLESMIKDLASRNYGSRLKNSLDFVVLFVPGESMLTEALAAKPDLFEVAFARSVVIASPNTLLPLLKAVAYGWRSQALEQNAAAIATIGQELYGRLTVFREHLEKVGSSLSRAVSAFNASVGSYESRILPQTRRLLEHGIEGSEDDLRAPQEVDRLPRQVERG